MSKKTAKKKTAEKKAAEKSTGPKVVPFVPLRRLQDRERRIRLLKAKESQ